MSALNGRRPGPQSLLLEGHFQRRGPFLSLSLVISKATMQIQKVLSVKTAPGGALPSVPVTHLCRHSRGGVTEDFGIPEGRPLSAILGAVLPTEDVGTSLGGGPALFVLSQCS